MSESQNKGCLVAILSIFGINLSGRMMTTDDLPFRQRDDFLSAAELSFYRVLATAVGNRAVVCPKVNLADIFFVVRPNENQHYRNKIVQKHVDFVLCDSVTMKPRCGIELDDSSHARRDRQDRDEFVNQVFAVGGLPLVRVPARAAYNTAELFAMVEPHLIGVLVVKSQPPVGAPLNATPTCPKCGIQMVERVAKKGQNAGQSFFGCPNYPKCREII
jgi:hypothetical protein